MTYGIQQVWHEGARVAAVARAERWTAAQAKRLNTSPAAILDAIRNGGWLPEQIERVESRHTLERTPPALVGVHPWIDETITARMKAKARAANEPTAMAIALTKARAA